MHDKTQNFQKFEKELIRSSFKFCGFASKMLPATFSMRIHVNRLSRT
ncbi:hypothetical protein AtDm6_0223 [Acetobacter tropicalis]|uniref:Uncharacterized protein n=1 Tax=Acetobacter tropicalis TaxID=104102 RepID=A0A095BC39_9PROT|nr:hypothetical protein AtDm6_0223 [Acetobacter tropicalis]